MRRRPATAIAGPYFEELRIGQIDKSPPPLTLTSGHGALHQAIVGDRLRLALDAELATAVTGSGEPLAHPALVCDVAIGHSTLFTQRVIGNLFYRGLALRLAPRIGDTLRTTCEVVGLRQNRDRAGRPPTGMAVLRIRTEDQHRRPALDFWRCAMLPRGDGVPRTEHADDLDAIGLPSYRDAASLGAPVDGWRLDVFRGAVEGPHLDDLRAGDRWSVEAGDVVSSAPELARLTLNLAAAHHDRDASGRGLRLVYGGHTIGLAAAQLTRALPSLVYVVGWRSCEHLGPVFEGDTLRSEIELEGTEPLAGGGGLAHLRSRVRAEREGGNEKVLDWRLTGVLA